MRDKEVIKALECYRGHKLFSFNGKKPEIYIHDIIDLINRQKAEIERLINMNAFGLGMKREKERADNAKAEAIKEFADRLKENSIATFSWNGVVLVEEIDNLLKEMEGDNNA